MKRPTSLLALFVALTLIAVVGHRQINAASKAALLVPDLLIFQPFRPSVLLTLPATRGPVELAGSHGNLAGIEYSPLIGRNRPAVLLALGVYPVDQDDHALYRLADGLAESGFVVLVPTSEQLNHGHIRPEEIDDLVDWFSMLRRDPRVDPNRIGFIGFSVGGGLSLAAAADPRIAKDVHFVMSMGGYTNAHDLLVAIGSHRSPVGSETEWKPSDLSRTAYYRQLIDVLPDPDERARFEEAFFVPDAPMLDEGKLSAVGRTVLEALTSEGNAANEASIDALPRDWLANLNAVSVDGKSGRLRSEVFALHDRSDTFVPVEQTRKMLGWSGVPLDYVEYDLFSHVVPAAPTDPSTFAGELWKLGAQLYRFYLSLE